MRTQEALDLRAAELVEQSRRVTARAAEAPRDQWLTEPNRTHVIESKE
ncbi:hypothetical protein [Mycobacteroides abscessus]|uniref:Uncharacterized protein n=1 Tax=Mycobacteroides abscessus subsp. abscessus TaxID=1185650 RepID=A0AB38D864_9MYCO|nr:hypothetical protein [Mycobacteroides abscessus]NOS09343.1 hypothetical protein [Mycobacteroides abscessus]NOS27176.1 hypothetical protein [Mycobacteroides abscessus]SIC00017.1 Uncharacterised protein [Mycobacteroides abscessus subsp. abscessus]SIC25551.1 Uncharacterised protein [Mycobacteroides abscessus subsp. abscessus]SIC25762.1 Uncharacterised protein [Mycobacteroides abscessus subsp. abscessus]